MTQLEKKENRRVTPDRISHLEPGQIFVFGSNALGHHGGGAAYTAMAKFGAVYGQGDGLQGQSYAISTMEGIEAMRENVDRFIAFAKQHPELTFLVTRIGCGIAGYTVAEVAPLLAGAAELQNVWQIAAHAIAVAQRRRALRCWFFFVSLQAVLVIYKV